LHKTESIAQPIRATPTRKEGKSKKEKGKSRKGRTRLALLPFDFLLLPSSCYHPFDSMPNKHWSVFVEETCERLRVARRFFVLLIRGRVQKLFEVLAP
jgi:hypothetical protein